MIPDLKLVIIIILLFLLFSYFNTIAMSKELNQGFLVLVDRGFVRVYFSASGVSLSGLSIGDCSLNIPYVSLNGVGFIDVNSSGVWLTTSEGVVKESVDLGRVSGFLKCAMNVLNSVEHKFTITGISVYSFKSKGSGGELNITGNLEFMRDLGFAANNTSYVLVIGTPLDVDVSGAKGMVEVEGNNVLRRAVELKSTSNGLWGMITPSIAWLNGLYYVRRVHVLLTIETYAVNLSGDLVACMIGYLVPDVKLKIVNGAGEVSITPWVDYYNVTRVLGVPRCIVPYPLYLHYINEIMLREPVEPWLKGVVERGDIVEYVVNASGVVVGGSNFSKSPYSRVFDTTGSIEFDLESKLMLNISDYGDLLNAKLQLPYRNFKYNPEPKSSTPICLDVVESSCLMYTSPLSPTTLGEEELEKIWSELSRGVDLRLYTTTLLYDQLSSYTSIYVSRKPYLALALGLDSYNIPLLGITPRNLNNISVIAFKPQLIVLDNTLTIPVINTTMSLDNKYYSNIIVDSFYMLPLLVRTHANNLTITSATFTTKGYISYSYRVDYNYTLRINTLKGLWRNISVAITSYKPKTINNKLLNATIEIIASCIDKCSINNTGGLINIAGSNGRPIRLIIIIYGDESDVRLLANNTKIFSGYGEHNLRSILLVTKTLHIVNGSLLLLSWTPMLPLRNNIITISITPYIVERKGIEITKTNYPYRLPNKANSTITSTKTTPRQSELDYMLKTLTTIIIATIIIAALYQAERRRRHHLL